MRLLTEFRYAVHSLRQAGGFTTKVVITLGLGLGLCVTVLVAAGARSVPDNWWALLLSTRDAYVMGVRPLLQALGVAVLLVLLVSCGNVAGLLLIRAIRRLRELALRHALGARWSAIARMLLAEAVVVGASAIVRRTRINRSRVAGEAGRNPAPRNLWRWICGDGSVASPFRRKDAGGPCASG